MKALYPGSFDPITNGHIDVIQQAHALFDAVVIGVANNPEKNYLFDMELRIHMIHTSLGGLFGKDSGISIGNYNGLTIDYAHAINVDILIRGLRAVSDFEAEFQMTLFNRKKIGKIAKTGMNTLFFIPDEKRVYLSSSAIKGIANMGGDVSCFVPWCVDENLKKKFKNMTFDPEKCGGDPRYNQCRIRVTTCPFQHTNHGNIFASEACPRLKMLKKGEKLRGL